MTRDFSIYPKLTPAQKDIIREVGLTFLSLQCAEQVIQCCVSLVFFDEKATTWKDVLSMRDSDRRKTLGQLINRLHERAEVQEGFKQQLNEFVQNRNRFIHSMFTEPEYLLDTEESVTNAREFLVGFQQQIWDIQNVFMGYNILFCKVLGIENQVMEDQSEHSRKHMEQTWSHFTKVMNFK